MRFILLAPERIVNTPREVAVIKTNKPRIFEKTSVITNKIPRTVNEIIL